ncbi:protein-tyrosine phosphatase [Stackebrandtia albiflava]|uniref:Protein-tyrosine phosphatase n=1 Tax=Stackebrandtia albiflava TaxID=406432 RepID=A0A562UQR6_9ACTN|nr:tyrosine-protein phosphatase [Stackebrandtia albiflava]TWJ07947.1 protein-tyrosine phosphatase [Stackebrandtia albiflava]
MALIELEGTPNLRDVGGLHTADGRTVKSGLVYRSSSLSGLTPADVTRVAELELRTVIDFRTSDEVRTDGPDRLPEGVEPVALPVGGGSIQQFYALAVSGDPGRLTRVLGDGGGARLMCDVNRGFVDNDAERAQFGKAVGLAAGPDGLPVLYHCTAGKDRTGWMTAILLTLLGVPRDSVIADYLASNEFYRPRASDHLAMLIRAGVPVDLFIPVLEQRPEYLTAAFDTVDRRYGSFDGFVTDGLGLTPEAVDGLRERLLD